MSEKRHVYQNRRPIDWRARLASWLNPATASALEAVRQRYNILWEDHLRRCNCHDSWDQCPCTSSGHKNRASRLACPNGCCPWCSMEYEWEVSDE